MIEIGCRHLALSTKKLYDGKVINEEAFKAVKGTVDAIHRLVTVIEVPANSGLPGKLGIVLERNDPSLYF